MASYQNVTYQTRVFAERVLSLKGERLFQAGPLALIAKHSKMVFG